MVIALIILLVLEVVSFVYYGTILPSIRWHLRLSVFALRDKLRSLAVDKREELDENAYMYLQQGMNTVLNFLYDVDLRTFVAAHLEISKNPSLRTVIEERCDVIESCKIQEYIEIKKGLSRIFSYAFLANSAGFFLWAVPLFFTINKVKVWYKTFLANIICAPERETDRLTSKKLAY